MILFYYRFLSKGVLFNRHTQVISNAHIIVNVGVVVCVAVGLLHARNQKIFPRGGGGV